MYGRVGKHPVVSQLLAFLKTARGSESIQHVARELHVSMFHLEHLVRRDLNRTVHELLRDVRVENARRLIVDRPDRTLGEIATACDYTPQTMYRHFLAVYGHGPAEVRRAADRTGDPVPTRDVQAPCCRSSLSVSSSLEPSPTTSMRPSERARAHVRRPPSAAFDRSRLDALSLESRPQVGPTNPTRALSRRQQTHVRLGAELG